MPLELKCIIPNLLKLWKALSLAVDRGDAGYYGHTLSPFRLLYGSSCCLEMSMFHVNALTFTHSSKDPPEFQCFLLLMFFQFRGQKQSFVTEGAKTLQCAAE